MTNLQYLVPLSPQGQCFGSNHQGCSVKKGVRRNFAKFTGKHLCQGPFLMKLQYPVTLLKKRLQHRCFPVNFANFLRTPFSQNTSGRLLLVFGGMLERQQGKPFIHQGIGCNSKNVRAAAKTFQCRGRPTFLKVHAKNLPKVTGTGEVKGRKGPSTLRKLSFELRH